MNDLSSAVEYNRKTVPMEGLLEFEWVHNTELGTRYPVASVASERGISGLYALHSTLEALNGKNVRITVEWEVATDAD